MSPLVLETFQIRSATLILHPLYWPRLLFALSLQSNKVKRTPQDCINELIILNLNPPVVLRLQ